MGSYENQTARKKRERGEEGREREGGWQGRDKSLHCVFLEMRNLLRKLSLVAYN